MDQWIVGPYQLEAVLNIHTSKSLIFLASIPTSCTSSSRRRYSMYRRLSLFLLIFLFATKVPAAEYFATKKTCYTNYPDPFRGFARFINAMARIITFNACYGMIVCYRFLAAFPLWSFFACCAQARIAVFWFCTERPRGLSPSESCNGQQDQCDDESRWKTRGLHADWGRCNAMVKKR